MTVQRKVKVLAQGPFEGMQGRVVEFLGTKQRKPWTVPISMYRVALPNGMELTFAENELEEIK